MKRSVVILLLAALICADVFVFLPELGISLSDRVSEALPKGCRAGTVSYLVAASDENGAINDGRPAIVLDPGHGGSDPGAVNKALGMEEAEINLRIARTLADKLWSSGRVKVYLTREDLGPKERKTLEQRVGDAIAVNADLFISMHNNYAAKISSGAEIYVSGRETEASHGAYLLAEQIMRGFGDIGMRLRGIYCRMSENGNTDSEGRLYDYYGVIRMCTDRGIPSMLIEHGFLNELDKEFIGTQEAAELIAESEYHAVMRWFGYEPDGQPQKGSGDGDGSGMLDDADTELAVKAIMCSPDSPVGETFERLDTNGDRRIDSADISYIFMLKNGIACIPGKSEKSAQSHTVTADREDFKAGEKIKITMDLSGTGSLVSANGMLDFDQKCFAFEGAENVPENMTVEKDEEYGLVRWYLSPDSEKLPGSGQSGTDILTAVFVFKMTAPREDNGYSINSAVYSSTYYYSSDASIVTYGRDIRSVIIGKSGELQDETG